MPRTETSTGQQTAKGTAPAKLRLSDYQIEVVDPVTQAVTALGALEIADYAEELQRAIRDVASRDETFSGYMVKLAATCENPSEYAALCSTIEMEKKWGRGNPAPQKWKVYQSYIYRLWEDFDVMPGSTVDVPLVKQGVLLVDEGGNPIKESVTLDSISKIKKAKQGFTLEAAGPPFKERRQPTRQIVDRFVKPMEGTIEEEASEVVQDILWAFLHLTEAQSRRMIARLRRVLADFPVKEPRVKPESEETSPSKGETKH